MASNLDVKITADVADLQAKFAVAKAEANALAAEMRKLAAESAQGVLDPAGQAQLQQVAADFLNAKQEAASFAAQMRETSESTASVGGALEEIRGKIGAAFEITGIAAAYEAIKSVTEVVKELGERATQMHAMSEILGVTTDQFQAMKAAAAEGGTSVEVFARAGERLITILTEARDGSAKAEEKLLALGVSAQQINDPLFKLNDVLQVLHDRLLDASTAESTMNELIKDFGPRAALAAEAIKAYDGTAEGVATTMARLNGQTTEQIGQLHELNVQLDEGETKLGNLSSKALVWAANMSQWLQSHIAAFKLAGEMMGAPAAPKEQTNVGVIDRGPDPAAQAREMADQERQNAQAGLEAVKELIAGTQQGTTQRLALLKEYADLSRAYYQRDVDEVKKANTAVIAEQRAVFDAQVAASREAERAEDERVKRTLSGITSMIDADGRYLADQQHHAELERQFDLGQIELENMVTQAKSKALQDQTALQKKEFDQWKADWGGVFTTIESGLSSSLMGMIKGTQSFAQAMTNVFDSILSGFIQMTLKMGMQWIEGLIFQETQSKITSAAGVADNASVAAAAAMASVAAIPVYGWAMAPEVGATTYGEAMSYMVGERGADIPAGVNPMFQAHAREMVLPATLSEKIRHMTDTGGSAGGGNTVHLHVEDGGSDSYVVRKGDLHGLLRELSTQFKLA